MYIIIEEDLEVTQTEELSAEDLSAADMGVITIIDASAMLEYTSGNWYPIRERD